MKESQKKALVVVGGVIVAGTTLALLLSGGSASAATLPDEPQPPKPDQPQPPKPDQPGALKFDLNKNWGQTPPSLRKVYARIELAARIPGLARALAVKAFQASVAGQPPLNAEEVAAWLSGHPDLCNRCINLADGPASVKGLERAMKEGLPAPDDDGWALGSFGDYDILGSTAVYAGSVQGFMPLLKIEASRFTGGKDGPGDSHRLQGYVAGWIIYRFLYGPYKVLASGIEAANGDSRETWGRIFAAWANPAAFQAGNQYSKDAKARYLARAEQLGIDLAAVAYPWPPGTSFKTWKAKDFWARLEDYFARDVVDSDAPAEQQPQQPKPDAPPKTVVELPGGVMAYARIPVDLAADKEAPLVIALHGRNGDETALRNAIPESLRARVYFLRGPLPGADGGRLFFAPRLEEPDAVVSGPLDAAADTIVAGLQQLQREHPTSRVVAVGFSQGAALALRLAARGAVDGVYAHAGALPISLRPDAPAAVRVVQWHGAKDAVVPSSLDGATALAFKAAGYPEPRYTLDPDAGHRAPKAAEVEAAVTPMLRMDLFAGDPGMTLLQGSCAIKVTDPQRAAVALSDAVIRLARELRVGRPLRPDELVGIVDTFLTDEAPYCAVKGQWADAPSAQAGYMAVRAMLRGLVGRGLVLPGDAENMLADVRASAMKAGADSGQLEPLGVS